MSATIGVSHKTFQKLLKVVEERLDDVIDEVLEEHFSISYVDTDKATEQNWDQLRDDLYTELKGGA